MHLSTRNTLIAGVLSMGAFHVASAMIAESLGLLFLVACGITICVCGLTFAGTMLYTLRDAGPENKKDHTLMTTHILSTSLDSTDTHFSYTDENKATIHVVLRSAWSWINADDKFGRTFELVTTTSPSEASDYHCDNFAHPLASRIALTLESTDENRCSWKAASEDSPQVALHVSKRRDVQSGKDLLFWQYRPGKKDEFKFVPLFAHTMQTYRDWDYHYTN